MIGLGSQDLLNEWNDFAAILCHFYKCCKKKSFSLHAALRELILYQLELSLVAFTRLISNQVTKF